MVVVGKDQVRWLRLRAVALSGAPAGARRPTDAKPALDRKSQLFASKAISVEEAKLAESSVVKAKAELSRAEAALAGAAAMTPPGYGDGFLHQSIDWRPRPDFWTFFDDRTKGTDRWSGAMTRRRPTR